MKKIVSLVLLTLSIVALQPQNAQAIIDWDWDFTNNNPVVDGSTEVVLMARIFNNSTAGETLGNQASDSTFYVSFADDDAVSEYGFIFGTNGLFFTQFSTPIIPGDFLDFTFGKYTPNSVAPDGTYTAFSQIIGVTQRDPEEELGQITRCYSWTVSEAGAPGPDGCNPNGGGNGVVPEPATMALFASGLVGCVLRKRKA